MWNLNNNATLRKKLKLIVENNIGHDIGKQIDLIRKLAYEVPHEIQIIEQADPSNGQTWMYNCYTFSFGLKNHPQIIKYSIGNIYPNSKFTNFVIKKFLKEIDRKFAQDNDYIIYFDQKKTTHAGIVSGQKIISKWGTGHRWKHRVYEVPIDYGNDIKFFKRRSKEDLLDIFVTWAKDVSRKS
jgi:hypothetical protein